MVGSEPSQQMPSGRWELQLLGGLSARNGDQVLDHIPSRSAALLLAKLALEPRSAHARDRLAEWLWPEVAERRGRTADASAATIRRARLRRTLATLTALLDTAGIARVPAIIATRETLRLNGDMFDTDVGRFEAHVRRHDADAARACYRGELLPGVEDHWLDEHRARLAGLYQRIDDSSAGDAVEEDGGPPNAPLVPYVTRFFGRRDDTERLLAALATHRVVVVRGPGGCGKTRFCAEVASHVTTMDSSTFVALADCVDAAQLPDRMRAALKLLPAALPVDEQLVSHLSGRRALLVLDNFEQLVGAAAESTLAALLQRLPDLQLLLTTRLTLQALPAFELELRPLPLPEHGQDLVTAARNPCVALFVDRARAARADFHLHGRNVDGLVAVCQALEGLPLAIELAASRVREHSPASIRQQLQQGISVLARRAPSARREARHASLEAALDWSWNLLAEPERHALVSLVVLSDGWTWEQAQAVLGGEAPEERIGALVRHSLIRAQTAGWTRGRRIALRLQMFDSVRSFALDKASQAQLVLARHRLWRHFRAMADVLAATHALADDADLPNLTVAIEFAMQAGEFEAAIAIGLGLGPHGSARGLATPALNLLQKLVEQAPPSTPGWVPLMALLPRLLTNAGMSKEAQAHAARALQVAGDDVARLAHARVSSTLVRWLADRDSAAALEPARQALHEARVAGLPDVQARALLLLGGIRLTLGHDVQEAGQDFERAEQLFGKLRDPRSAVLALPGRVMCLIAQKQHRAAIAVAEAGLERAAGLSDVATQLLLSSRLSVCHEALRQYEDAVAVCRRQTKLAVVHGMSYHVAYGLWNQCRALARLRRAETAAVLMAASHRYWVERFGPLDASDARHIERVRRLVAVQLGAERCSAAWARGWAMSAREAVLLAGG